MNKIRQVRPGPFSSATFLKIQFLARNGELYSLNEARHRNISIGEKKFFNIYNCGGILDFSLKSDVISDVIFFVKPFKIWKAVFKMGQAFLHQKVRSTMKTLSQPDKMS